MGLAIGVGALVRFEQKNPKAAEEMRRDLAYINTVLEREGLPTHQEPESFDELEDPWPPTRASLNSFPYSWLHYLRRFAAHVIRDPRWIPYPVEPGEDPADDPVLRQLYRQLQSHLLCHSDSEGYYLPVDFDEIFFDPKHKIRGGALGSSYRLREELLLLTDPLEIEVDEEGNLDDDYAAELAAQRPTGAPFAIERLIWISLYEAARLSIEHKTAIVFF
ncbi:hypothetical protein DL240_13840 [Lujinxingia litoralis]|uniref:Uncharacterized protein n=1 Tax=Lujinxingia litoralis TaxID=2211119 RepID=A0A328C8Y9_9DELT|nr:hypothetical protein [Lujinxingia litoralis]RAL21209.1 hypothetical protein DL240_13840 [Lujinxingia litoralis]